MELLLWLEQLSFSMWLNASPSIWAFPMFLFVHTLGMSIVAGGSAMISLALLGLWPAKRLRPLERLYPALLAGFVVSAITGTALFMKAARTYGNNPDFYVKLAFVGVGMILLFVMRWLVFGDPELESRPVRGYMKVLAWASLLCWFGAIVTGRLLAYVGPVAGVN